MMLCRNGRGFRNRVVTICHLAVAHPNKFSAGLSVSVALLVTYLFAQTPAFADSNDGWQEVPGSAPPAGAETLVDALSERSLALSAAGAAVSSLGLQTQSAREPGRLRNRVLAMETVAGEPVIAFPEIREVESLTTSALKDSELLSGTSRVSPTSVSNMDMFVGELRVVGKVNVTRVAIGNGGIIRAELLKTGELLLIAQGEGSSSLRLWHSDGTQSGYNIRISKNDPETRVRMERMVRLRVRMVEFRKSALGELGINWSDGANGPTFAAAGDAFGNNLFRPEFDGFNGLPNQVSPFSTYFGIASDIKSRINFLAQNGDAVTLAEPVLSAVNGGTASFLAGGEVPYPSIGSDGQTVVDFKEYGVRLQIAPRIDNGGNVRTFVETEISEIDEAVTVNGAPGLLTRRAQTEVNVRSGETIVISGLLRTDNSKALDSIPGLGRLPIIGRLFSSRSSRSGVSELVIFVTPEVVEPAGSLMTEREGDLFAESTNRLQAQRSSLQLME